MADQINQLLILLKSNNLEQGINFFGEYSDSSLYLMVGKKESKIFVSYDKFTIRLNKMQKSDKFKNLSKEEQIFIQDFLSQALVDFKNKLNEIKKENMIIEKEFQEKILKEINVVEKTNAPAVQVSGLNFKKTLNLK